MGLNAAPYVANTTISIAAMVDNALPCGHFGDLATSPRYITAEKALRANPNTKIVVGAMSRW